MLSPLMPFANGAGSSHETDGANANAIEKALSILVVLVRQDRPLGTVQISRLTGFHKATTSRILATLERFGLVVQNDRSRKYLVGPLGYQLGTTQLSASLRRLAQLAEPDLVRLASSFDCVAQLDLWAGRQAIVAASVGRGPGMRQPGDAVPLSLCAGGRAILAALDPQRAHKLVAPAVQPVTAETLAETAQLRSELDLVRVRGFVAEDVTGTARAVAMTDPQGLPLGALTLRAPAEAARSGPDMVAALAATVRRLGREIAQSAAHGLETWHYEDD